MTSRFKAQTLALILGTTFILSGCLGTKSEENVQKQNVDISPLLQTENPG